jgi:hypothetical protein
MMKTAVLLVLAFLVAGCVSVKPVHLADGSTGHSISCNGALQNIGACIEKAGEICGSSGYSVVDQSGSAQPYSQAQGAFQADKTKAVGGFAATSGSIVTRNLFVKCGKS